MNIWVNGEEKIPTKKLYALEFKKWKLIWIYCLVRIRESRACTQCVCQVRWFWKYRYRVPLRVYSLDQANVVSRQLKKKKKNITPSKIVTLKARFFRAYIPGDDSHSFLQNFEPTRTYRTEKVSILGLLYCTPPLAVPLRSIIDHKKKWEIRKET